VRDRALTRRSPGRIGLRSVHASGGGQRMPAPSPRPISLIARKPSQQVADERCSPGALARGRKLGRFWAGLRAHRGKNRSTAY